MPQLFPNVFNLSSLNGANGFALNGVTAGDNTGESVNSAGDINGDGVNDIIIGTALFWPYGANSSGSAFVVFGQKGDYPPVLELASLNGTQGFRINGVNINEATGFEVSGAGDVNGDGIDDVLVSAPYTDHYNVIQAGSVYVVFGQDTPFPGVLALSNLTGSNGFRINAFSTGCRLGNALSGGGDVNGDGLADVVMGGEDGHVWVVFGKRSGFPAVFELEQIDGNNGFRLLSTEEEDHFGKSVGHADVNGDGLSDVIIGADWAWPEGRTYAGSAFVVFGSRAPFPGNFSMGILNGSNGFRVNGIQPDDGVGSAVGSAGDFNGDGVEDFMVGASVAGQPTGSAYVVYGRRTPFPAALELGDLDGRNGFTVSGVFATDNLNSDLGVGDFNGDGLSDLLLGVAQVPSGQTGMVVVVFGQRAAMATTLDLAALDGSNGFRLYGVTLGDEAGLSTSTAGDFNGDGIDDILMASPVASPGGRNQAGVVYMVYGDHIEWLNAVFFVHQNETLTLDTHHLNVSVSDRWDHVNFQVEGVTHGQFEYANQRGRAIEGFSYEEVSQGQVLFKHDGSDQAPQFDFRASHVLASSNASAAVVFEYWPPVLLNNSIALLQGQSWVLSPSQLGARAYLEGNTPTLQFSILGAEHLQFSDKASHQSLNSFSQEAVTAGNVVATHDGSPHAPAYQVTVSDAFNQVGPEAAQVYFTDRPSASSGSSTALRDGLIAGGVAAAAVLGLGLGWLYKRHKERNRQSEQSLNMRLMESNGASPIIESEQTARQAAVPTFKV